MNNTITHKQLLRQYFADLELISQQQAGLLGAANPDKAEDTISQLMGLIEQRQQIMNQIEAAQDFHKQQGIDSEAEPNPVGPALFAAIQSEEAAIRASMAAIQANDVICQTGAQKLLQMAGMELGSVRKNKQALKSYAGSSDYTDSQFFDRHE